MLSVDDWNAELFILAPIAGEILNGLSEDWQDFDQGEQTFPWNQAVSICLDAGLVEVRLRFAADRLDCDPPEHVEGEFDAMGAWFEIVKSEIPRQIGWPAEQTLAKWSRVFRMRLTTLGKAKKGDVAGQCEAFRSAKLTPPPQQPLISCRIAKEDDPEHPSQDLREQSIQTEQLQLGPLEKALALLVSNPQLSNTEIAKQVGVNRTTLNKPSWLKFQQARQAMRGTLPNGSKSSDGTIEAIDPD